MNPFDMRGPAFLALYLFMSVIGLTYLYLVSRGLYSQSPRSPSADGRRHLRDPYLLAFLRGGVGETLKTVAFSLNKRKLLSSLGATLVATRSKESLQAVRHPLEVAFLSQCSSAQTVARLLKNTYLKVAVEDYAVPLRESGLTADDSEFSRRLPAFLGVAGALAAFGAIKVIVALQRGHTNVIFLILLTIIAVTLAFKIFRRHRTFAGDRALADQQTLFARLKSRVTRVAAAHPTDEAVLVAAAFGLEALPASGYPFAARIRRQAQNNSNNSSCSSCGSSCGGGGCGGGCGGCGS